jgi:small-conductance mechanosensitive channel
MLPTRIRITGAVLLAALLTSTGTRSEEKELAPPPRPVPSAKEQPTEPKAKTGEPAPEESREGLDQLARDWIALLGGVNVAHQRFTAQADELDKARQRLDALKQPEPKVIPPSLRARDVEPALKVAQQLAEYHANRLRLLEALTAATAALQKRQAEFDLVLEAHKPTIIKVRALRNLAPKPPELPAALDPERTLTELNRLTKLSEEVRATSTKAKADLAGVEKELAGARALAAVASAKFEELKAGSAAALEAFKFEDQVKGMDAQQLVDEFARVRKELDEKMAALKSNGDDFKKAGPAAVEARARRGAIKEPPVPLEAKSPSELPPLDEAVRQLVTAQQYLRARIRTADERAEKTAALSAALDEQEKKANAYAATLEDARHKVMQLATVAAEIEQRVGRGDLDPAKAPDGLPEAASTTSTRVQLEADAATVHKARAELQAEREGLRKPDPGTDDIKAHTAPVLARVSERLDLLTDLKTLASDYSTPVRERPESEQKRLTQLASDRRSKEAGRWDWFLGLDRSKQATDLSELLDSYYKELIALDEKEDNLKRQREALVALIESTQKEADHITKARVSLEKRPAQGEGASAQLAILSDKIDVAQLRALLERHQWDDWLAVRLAPEGLKSEAALYHNELARLAVVGGANARRIQALTGNAPPEPGKSAPEPAKQPATGGEIGAARSELFDARARGLTITGIKIGAVVLAALVLPALVMRVLRRAIRGGTDDAGNPSPVLAALRRVLKVVVWAAAAAVVLSVLGYDVTALVVALAIGALALVIAARPMIADVLGSLSVFADRRFKLGDVIRLGGGEPARVVGLTWRSTALRNTNGLVVSVPNRQMTEAPVENLSRGAETYDALSVTISTDKDAGKVISVIRAAIAQCKNLTQDHGVTVVSYTQRGTVKVVQYRFWWFLKDYEVRNKTRDEVFARIAVGLAHEDMSGIELTLA